MSTPSVILAILATQAALFAQSAVQPNVLFLYVEDMNTDLSSYGHPVVQSPNIDALAATGFRFEHAYCPAPICNPSRIATMLGMRPSTTGFTRNEEFLSEDTVLGVPVLPLRFRQAGYQVGGTGKVFHGSYEHPGVWHQYVVEGHDSGPVRPTNPVPQDGSRVVFWGPYENGADGSGGDMSDTKVSNAAIQMLETMAEPWFIAAGYFAPHSPLIYPESYDALYDPATDVPPLPTEDVLGLWKNEVPIDAYRTVTYLDPAWDHDPDAGRREMTAAYWRTLTFVDDEIGRVVDRVAQLGLRERTIIVFVSDHGWSNGFHCRNSKQALFEQSARVPLIISVPGATTDGQVTTRPVDLVDLYPTLMDYCGLSAPANLDGTSLRLLIQDPSVSFRPAFSVDARSWSARWNRMVRTDRYKFIHDERGTHQLYDLQTDPGEYDNLYGDPGMGSIEAAHIQLLEANGVLGATWNNYNRGSPGTLGVPGLTASGNPVLGSVIDLNVANSSGVDTFSLLLGGFRGASLDTGLGGRLYLVPDFIVNLTIPPTSLAIPFGIPNSPVLSGLSLVLQSVQVDAGVSSGLAFSRGLRLFMYPQ